MTPPGDAGTEGARSVTRTLLSERARTTLYLQRGPDGPLVLKILNAEEPDRDDVMRLDNELSISRDLGIPSVRRALRRERVDGRHALVLEYVEGHPLEARAVRDRRDLEDFLRTAIQLAQALGELHQRQIIHRDLKPRNVIFDEARKVATIIDFGLSSRIDLRTTHLGNPERLEGTLAYMSPEQTGRMNRAVDYRTDLYSLGVTFFELLTGRLPFETLDAIELVHCHIARSPPAPHAVNPRVPELVSDLVLKLLAKDADERYETAFGLRHDLERAMESLSPSGGVARFALAQRDHSGRLQLAGKLWGREDETRRLLKAFERVASGRAELILVAGASGVGKSAVVHEVHRGLAARRGYFIQGKFDQLQRNIPYYAPIQAFRELVDLLLTEGEDTLATWRARLLEAVGELGNVLTALIPGLELVLGPQPQVPELFGVEAQSRFHYVLGSFLRAMSRQDHPLVLFLDDLQWADVASLKLIEALTFQGASEGASERGEVSFLFVGAYRDGEVGPAHPLTTTMDELRKKGASIDTLRLGNLAPADVEALTADAMRLPRAEVAELARTVHEKTQGNAFFVRQFLRSLVDKKLLEFAFDTGRWVWDLERIQGLETTDNVALLMTERMQRLPAAVLADLELAACIGHRFDLHTLAMISERSAEQTASDLWPAIKEGLITPLGNAHRVINAAAGGGQVPEAEFAFAHDRVQQAAYSLIAPEQKSRTHARVGRILLERTPPAAREGRLFDIVNQLNFGLELLPGRAERTELAALNLEAGRRASRSIAFSQAQRYFDTGAELLGAEGWSDAYPQMLALRSEAAEAAYYEGDFATARLAAQEVLAHARTVFDKQKAYYSLLMSGILADEHAEAIRVGLEDLALLGVTFPRAPTTFNIITALLRTKLALAGKTPESLVDLPRMTDETKLAAMTMIERMVPAAFRSGSKLFPLLVLRMVHLSVQHGNMPSSSFAYGSYAIMLSGVLGDLDGGYRFGQMALRLVDRLGVESFRPKVFFVFNTFIRHWKEPLANALAPLHEGYQKAREIGSTFDATWSAFYRLAWLYATGHDLVEVEREIGVYAGELALTEGAGSMGRILRQAVQNQLSAEEPAPHRLAGATFDEGAPGAVRVEDKTELCFFHAVKLELCTVFGEIDEALEHAARAEEHLEGVTAMPFVPLIRFHAALARLAAYRAQPGRARDPSLLKAAMKSRAPLRKWARHAPANYLHLYHLVEAEVARATGRPRDAREHYDRAIAAARESGHVHEEALALELSGDFYAEAGQPILADALLAQAVRAYRNRGAAAKVAELLRRHPELAPRALPAGADRTDSHSRGSVSSGASDPVDLGSMMKASRAIAGEIVMDVLVSRLVEIMAENAGAERGALLLVRDGELMVEARTELGAGPTTVREAVPLAEAKGVCEVIVRYVARTQEPLVLADAALSGPFQQTPYLRDGGVRSVLCTAIKHQGKLSGILYLENNLVADAFTPQRCTLLDLLSAQAAVSLENARLYETLDQRVKDQTRELRVSNGELSQALQRLRDTQKQLVLQEKLASLGALTAGIAHEIKNPLNFINNFAELSIGLADELGEELARASGAPDPDGLATIGEILGDLRQNAAKINEHGKRADGIVRAMLEHSRAYAGDTREVDVNALVAEYADLAYQGIRSQDAQLHITIETSYDPTLGRIETAPQELGRVFVNLVNNACYAMRARKLKAGPGYVPTLRVGTRAVGPDVEISVRDNGTGIPSSIRDQVYNPFFTTKPAGEGTGLGLSISHEIIHGSGGTLRFETEEGSFTEFVITLPRRLGEAPSPGPRAS